MWMESYKGAIFEANYVAGSKNSAGKSKSGRLLQNGCEYMIRIEGVQRVMSAYTIIMIIQRHLMVAP